MPGQPLIETLPEEIPADFDYSTVDWDKVLPASEITYVKVDDVEWRLDLKSRLLAPATGMGRSEQAASRPGSTDV